MSVSNPPLLDDDLTTIAGMIAKYRHLACLSWMV